MPNNFSSEFNTKCAELERRDTLLTLFLVRHIKQGALPGPKILNKKELEDPDETNPENWTPCFDTAY